METRSFNIPASSQSMVEEQIEKLNRRARKLNLPQIILSYGQAFKESRIIKGNKVELLVIPVELSGPLSVSYDGWQFIATLQHLPTGENIIRSITDQFMIPSSYKDCGSNCQHCQVNRYRKDTYLVHNTDGRWRQVGSTCIKDFLGGNSPDDILKRANLAAELVEFMTGVCHGEVGSSQDILFYIVDFLAQTSACIRDHGWLSKGEAIKTGAKATASWVQDHYNPPEGLIASEVFPDDRRRAQESITWAESLSDEECDNSDYLHNIRAIVRSGMVGFRTMGYAASIIAAYDRDLVQSKKRLSSGVSIHLGSLKVREEFDLKLKKHFSGESSYGTYHKYIFNDSFGNVLSWTASSSHGLEEGKRYRIRGTVKAHTEFKGIKQTEINRCEVVTYYE